MENSQLSYECKHQIILPKSCVSKLIVTEQHQMLGHKGRQQVIAKLRETLWIVKVNSLARSELSKCVKCHRICGHAPTQKMANLPEGRLIADHPPFTFVGVDLFDPLLVKQGRSQLKRYGVLFTCFTTRAVHIEVAHGLDTSSFIQSLRRFVARRGQVLELRSDNGSNFVGAEHELAKVVENWNKPRSMIFVATQYQMEIQRT